MTGLKKAVIAALGMALVLGIGLCVVLYFLEPQPYPVKIAAYAVTKMELAARPRVRPSEAGFTPLWEETVLVQPGVPQVFSRKTGQHLFQVEFSHELLPQKLRDLKHLGISTDESYPSVGPSVVKSAGGGLWPAVRSLRSANRTRV